MSSYVYSSYICFQIVKVLYDFKSISSDDMKQLHFSCWTEFDKESGDRYNKPMVWIGIYIATASFLCILAMSADLFHGFRNKKFWIPSKYFSLNAAWITVIAVTMKLPVDLTAEMTSYMDQAARLGSLGFMCTMMANLMPSLASMDNKTLLANLIGLSILVITVIVNICILSTNTVIYRQIYNTSDMERYHPPDETNFRFIYIMFPNLAYTYIAMILLLLIIMISSSLTISTSKKILDSKYDKATNNISLNDQKPVTVENLRKHVRRYWVMAETGSPQFVMASNPLSIISGLICLASLIIALCTVCVSPLVSRWRGEEIRLSQSPYKWSTTAIFITQFIGVVVGSIAPILRYFSLFSFKSVTIWSKNHFMFFKLESYWTQKLHEWKQSPIPFLSRSRRLRSIIYNSKDIILSICIGFQTAVVVTCKLLWLIATVVSIFIASCLYRLKLFMVASRTDDVDADLSNYVLQVDNKTELTENTLKRISKSMNSFITKAEKGQNNNLLELLEKSTGFEGVRIFDTLPPVEFVNSWSLPILTLACIAIALPDISKDEVEGLLRSVGEGLSFTHLVEERLNTENKYVNIRNTTLNLWHEVEDKFRWLGNSLAKNVFEGKTTKEVIECFSEIATKVKEKENPPKTVKEEENPPRTLIAANSMYRITQTILNRWQSNPITSKQLLSMIADIFCACFTNIPRVITMRCHESVIEKREASVKAAARLLGKTTKIIERLEKREVPSMDEDKKAYIDEWRLYMRQSIP